MNQKELEVARFIYSKSLPKTKNIKEIDDELRDLTENPYVRRYLQLKMLKAQAVCKKNQILMDSFDNIALETKNSNNIYVFFGFYNSASSSRSLVPLNIDNPCARYRYYVNLETLKIKPVTISDSKEFETKNNVIYLDDPCNNHDISYYLEGFNELRTNYFELLVDNSQEEATKQIIKKR